MPGLWVPRVDRIAFAIRRESGDWHRIFLAVAGALIDKGVAHELIPILCRAISLQADSTRNHLDRFRGGQSVVEWEISGSRTIGMDDLRKRWPHISDAIEDALEDQPTRIRKRRSVDAGDFDSASAQAEVSRIITGAGDGVTVVLVSGGINAEMASVEAAAVRAAKLHASPDAVGTRAPIQSKTGIAVPTHQEATDVASLVRSRGVDARRFFSPPSLKKLKKNDADPDEYECRFKEAADAIMRGGQSVKAEFCDGRRSMPCPFRNVCLAADGATGPVHSRVGTSSHASMNVLSDATGTTGVLVVHNPPDILSTTAISYEEMVDAQKDLDLFSDRYVAAIKPALSVLTAWVREIGQFYTSYAIEDIFVEAADAIDPEELGAALVAAKIESFEDAIVDTLCCVRAAPLNSTSGHAPPVKKVQMLQARQNKGLALRIGNASRVLYLVWKMCSRVDAPFSMMLTPKGRTRVLSATGPRDPYITALTRQGSTVVVGSSVDLAAIERVAGHAPKIHRVRVAPNAEVERMMIRWQSGTRRNLLDRNGQLRSKHIHAPIQKVAEWLEARSWIRSCAVMTFDFLSIICSYARAPRDSTEAAALESTWRAHGHPAKTLKKSAAEILPALARIPEWVVWTRFGANEDLQRFEALATLGNPFPSQSKGRAESAYLQLDQDGMRQRQREQCAVILAQAHDAIAYGPHPRVSSLHLGEIAPSGPGWIEPAPATETGRPRRTDAVPPADFQSAIRESGMSMSDIAKRLGVSKGTLSKYASGSISAPIGLFRALKDLH